jgi:hypothetical protein
MPFNFGEVEVYIFVNISLVKMYLLLAVAGSFYLITSIVQEKKKINSV